MIQDLGTIRPGTTVYIPFHTFDSNDPSASVTLTGLATSDIEIYKDGSTTQRASDNGYTLLDTDGIDFDSITGIHGISINLADNSTAGFYAAGSQYWVVISSVTVDAATINFVLATFRIGYPDALINTTIATLSSQTSFTLTSGPAEDDALNGMSVIIHDVASAVQLGQAVILDYTGSTKTVTLAAGTTFTAAAADNISIMRPMPLQPATMGRTIAVDSSGRADANVTQFGGTNITSSGGRPEVNLSHIAGSSVSTSTAQLGVNVVNFGGSAGTFSGGRPEVNTTHAAGTAWGSGAITAASIASDAITAAKIADGAIDAGALAADCITNAKIADNAIAVENIADNAITAAKIASDAITAAKIADGAIDAATFTAGAINNAAMSIDGSELTAIPWNAAWDAEVQSECTDALNAYDPPTKAELDVLGTAALATASALSTVDTVVDTIQVTTDKLDDTLEDDGGTYRFTENALEESPAGGGGGTDWSADERTAIRSILGIPGSGTTPADPSTGILDTIRDSVATRASQSSVDTIDDFLDTEVAAIKAVTDKLGTLALFSGTIANASSSLVDLGTLGLGDSELLFMTITILDVSTGEYHTRVISAYTGSTSVALLDTTLPFTTESGVDTFTVWAFRVIDPTYFNSVSVATYQAVDTEIAAIKAKTDNLPSDPADASDIAASFASLNTKVDTIDDFLDTEIAAIKAKTDNLPSDPADASDIASSFTTVNTKLDTIDDFLDTEVAAIKAKTDNLPSDPADQSAVEAAITSATSGLATQASVNTIDDFLDTEIAAIKAKTDNLPSDPADASDIASSFSAVNTKLDTIDDFLDTEVAAIKAKTDSLTFTVSGQVDANIQSVNDTAVTGTGESGDEWGPA